MEGSCAQGVRQEPRLLNLSGSEENRGSWLAENDIGFGGSVYLLQLGVVLEAEDGRDVCLPDYGERI